MAGTVKSFQVNTFAGGSLTADVIKTVKVKQGDLGADVTSQTGEIATVYAYADITGNITSATFIKTVASKMGGLYGDVTSQTGEIGSLSVYGNINGNIESATFIKKIASKAGGIGADAKITALHGDLLAVSTYDTLAGKLVADNLIKKIAVKAGDITGNVRAATIGSVSAINLDGAILSAAEIGKVTLKGNILDSYILGGYDIGMDGTFGGADDLLQGGNIKSVSAAKGQFARSFISAGYLPESPDTIGLPDAGQAADFGSISKVVFASKDPNPTFDYGIFAVTEIKPFKIGKEPAQTDGFFKVEIVGG